MSRTLARWENTMTVTLLDRTPQAPEPTDARASIIGLSRDELMVALARVGVP
jgi:DNA-binding transcriptional LysR family regulator